MGRKSNYQRLLEQSQSGCVNCEYWSKQPRQDAFCSNVYSLKCGQPTEEWEVCGKFSNKNEV